MRQETNNEMDLLLRRLGRRQDVFAPEGNHLDPDELNAYAENALPAAARARYTEHLAECSGCRELVVQLSASAAVVPAVQTEAVSVPSGLKKFLASLFSPMVLRYAAPALGLIVIAVIGIVMLRRDSTSDYVSQVREVQTSQPAVTQTPVPEQYANDSAPTRGQTSANASGPRNEAQAPTPIPQDKSAAVEQNAAAPKPESHPAAGKAEEPPPSKAQTVAADTDVKSYDATRQKEDEVKVAPAEATKKNIEFEARKRGEETATVRSRTAKNKTESKDAAAAAPATGGFSALSSERGRDDKDSTTETRSVAGRTFRKLRGVWTDTAYDGSRETVNLTRGGEQYRALIADEPAIKTIADQLAGEVIVVWKGTAYRIR